MSNQQGATDKATSSAIDAVLRKPIDTGLIPGVVALAATPDRIFYEGAFGKRAVDKPAPMTADSVFRIASMTKAVTTVAAMQLVELGRIRLDQPMREILPLIGEVKVLEGFDDSGTPRLREPKGPVTLHHLLTHTSGYSYDIFNADLIRYVEFAGLPSITTCKNDSLRVPLLFDPGKRWEYGIGIDLAGRVVEEVTGLNLERYMRTHIFEPLGMRDTTFLLRNDMAQRLVGTHARGGDGKPVSITLEFPQDGDFLMGGGGLFSTAADYLSFTRMLLAGGALNSARVLKPETVALMSRNAIGDLEVPVMRSANPALALDMELFPGQVKRWALGFLINTQDVEGMRAAGSLAWAGVHNTFFWIDPARRVTAVLMMQIIPANDPHVVETLFAFEQAVYSALR